MDAPSAALVAVRRVTRRFGERVAVCDLSFDLHAGEIVALLGPAGLSAASRRPSTAGRRAGSGPPLRLRQRPSALSLTALNSVPGFHSGHFSAWATR